MRDERFSFMGESGRRYSGDGGVGVVGAGGVWSVVADIIAAV